MKIMIFLNRSWMYNCSQRWYTEVDEMSVDEMSVDEMSVDEMSVDEMSVRRSVVDEMSVDELSWNPLHTISEQVVHHPLEIENFLRILGVDDTRPWSQR